MTAPAHPLLHRILSTTNTPWNDWTSCLVYHHKAVDEMSDWMERMHRFEVIMLDHIYPQVAEIARSDTEFEQMINKVELSVRDMAIADKHNRIRCEKIIIAWDKLSGLVRETLSKKPTREQIDALLDRCYEMRDDTSLDHKTRQEARNTTYALNRVLWDWNLSETITPLRFYPNRDPRFDRYKISI